MEIGKDWMRCLSHTQNKASRKRAHEEPEGFFLCFTDHSDAGTDELGEDIWDGLWSNPGRHYLVPDMDDEEEDGGGREDTNEEGTRMKEMRKWGREEKRVEEMTNGRIPIFLF